MNNDMLSAIDGAIGRERDAYELYLSLLKQAKNSNLQNLFRSLAIVEMRHEVMLRELKKSGNASAAREKAKLANPELNIGLQPSVSTEGVSDGFRLGIKMELEAQVLYTEMMHAAESPDIAELFRLLADEERSHAALLTDEYHKFSG